MRYMIKRKFNTLNYFIKDFDGQNLILTPDDGQALLVNKKLAYSIVRRLEKNPLTRGMYLVVPA